MTPPNAYTTYGWVLLSSIVFAVTLGQYAWRRRNVAGALSFIGMMIAGTSWVVAGVLQSASSVFAAKVFWEQVQSVAALSTVSISLCFALQYAGLGKWLTRRTLALLAVPPVALILLNLTNQAHNWVWTRLWVDARGIVHVTNGPATPILAVYAYLLVLLTWVILVWLFIRSPRHRGPVAMVLLAQVTTRAAYVIQVAYRATFAPFDLVIPLAMTAYMMYFLALFRFDGFELVPTARGTAIAHMSDGMLVLDDRNRVVDLNPAAETCLGVRTTEIIGRDATEYWETMPALTAAIRAPGVGHAEITLETGAERRCLDVTVTPLSYDRDQHRGRLLLARDITVHKQNEDALHAAYAESELRVAERTIELQQANATLEMRVADRARELTALYEVSAAAARIEDQGQFLDAALETTLTALRGEVGAILLQAKDAAPAQTGQLRIAAKRTPRPIRFSRRDVSLLESDLFAAVLASHQSLLIPDIATDPRVPVAMRRETPQTLLLVPLQADGQILGLVGVMRQAALAFATEEVTLLTTIADQIAVIVRSHHLRQEAQRVHLLAERQRVARDLHNSVTQSLYGLVAFTEAGQAQLESDDLTGVARSLARIGETTRQALREMRLFIHQARPEILQQEGLLGALQLRLAAVEGRADLRVQLCAGEMPRFPLPLEGALYQVAQEALNNILRHAHATSVVVNLRCETEEVILEISDDGRGFDVSHSGNGGMGLNNMREAIREVGGALEITSVPGKGTTVRATAPDQGARI